MDFINPSPIYTSMGDLLAHFRPHRTDVRPALLQRDAIWGSHNQSLRSELNLLRMELATRDEKERWLKQSFLALEEKVEDERRKSKGLKEENIAVEEGLKEEICVLLDRVRVLEKGNSEKGVSGFSETIMVLEREKEALEAEVSRTEVLEREKNEAMQRILSGKLAVEAEKDDYEEKNLELVDRIGVLEREKRGLEAAISEKDEVIKVLNEGQNSAGVVAYSSEYHVSVNDNVGNSDGKSEGGMTCTNAGKRRRSMRNCEELGEKILNPACEHLLASTGVVDDEMVLVPCEPCEKNTEMNSTGCTDGSNGGDVVVACRWEVDQDLLDAFDADPELCLKAVCALYRQHTRLSDSASTSLSPGSRVFKPDCSLQGITLGEYLTTEDPECRRMRKLVGKLNKFDPLAVGVCRSIAKQHFQQVFEIYNKKVDPVFLS